MSLSMSARAPDEGACGLPSSPLRGDCQPRYKEGGANFAEPIVPWESTSLSTIRQHPVPLLCRFLGRLHDDRSHTRRREASEKRQGTKSREVERRRRSGLYGDLIGAGGMAVVD